MNRLIDFLEKITGKKVERHNTSALRKLVDLKPIKYIKARYRRDYLTTNDLDGNNKPYSDYLKRRENGKKDEPKVFDDSDIDLW